MKKILYIPSDAVKEMYAFLQKFCSMKCQYIDVQCLFIFPKFQEFYELDAEIGYMVLDWEIALSSELNGCLFEVYKKGINGRVHLPNTRSVWWPR